MVLYSIVNVMLFTLAQVTLPKYRLLYVLLIIHRLNCEIHHSLTTVTLRQYPLKLTCLVVNDFPYRRLYGRHNTKAKMIHDTMKSRTLTPQIRLAFEYFEGIAGLSLGCALKKRWRSRSESGHKVLSVISLPFTTDAFSINQCWYIPLLTTLLSSVFIACSLIQEEVVVKLIPAIMYTHPQVTSASGYST
eukprot:m.170538 g.170538  ORF g.170538 m.170538 type:complete len:190 (+) comp39042_c3_seq23:1610-2179(+)